MWNKGHNCPRTTNTVQRYPWRNSFGQIQLKILFFVNFLRDCPSKLASVFQALMNLSSSMPALTSVYLDGD